MRLRITRVATRQVDEIYAHIAKRDPLAAPTMVGLPDRAFNGLLEHPPKGRRGRVAGARERVVLNASIVADAITGDTVDIVAVLRGDRAWPSSLNP